MPALTMNEMDLFLEELASLQRSAVPLPDGLRELSAHGRRTALTKLSADVAQGLEQGKALGEAVRASSVKVPAELAALLECAEVSGDAGAILRYAHEHARRRQRHRESMLTAMYYPAFILFAMIFMMVLLVNTGLVEIRRTMMGGLEDNHWRVLDLLIIPFHGLPGYVLLALSAAGLLLLCCVEPLRDRALHLLARAPGFRHFAGLGDTAVSMKFLGTMLAKGVAMPAACRAASLAVSHPASRESLRAMGDAAEQGHPVHRHLSPLTPTTAAYLFRQAEANGGLPDTCVGIGEYCERRYETLSRRQVMLLEPLLLLLLGLVVAVFVILLYGPFIYIPVVLGRY